MVREGYNSITLDEITMTRLKEIQARENFNTIPETIRSLLPPSNTDFEFKIRLLMNLVDFKKKPFSYHMLELGATKTQVNAIFDLMDSTEKAIDEKKNITHQEFERVIYRILPKHEGDYHIAESIVGCLNKEGRWTTVYEYMIKNGMNPNNMGGLSSTPST